MCSSFLAPLIQILTSIFNSIGSFANSLGLSFVPQILSSILSVLNSLGGCTG